jgi:hypothetical protein
LAAFHLQHRSVVAGLAISGIFDLEPLRDTSLNIKLQLSAHEIETLSPLRTAAVQKPLAIAYGERELRALITDAVRLHELRRAAGALGPLLEVPAADHFTILQELRSPERRLLAACADLLPR